MFAVEVTSAGTPPAAAMRAAWTLVTMPPEPTPARPTVPISTPSRSLSGSSTTGMRSPPSSGCLVYSASTSESSSRTSALTRFAVSAAMRSLSPNLISWVATASFSLMIGSTPRSRSRSIWRCVFW